MKFQHQGSGRKLVDRNVQISPPKQVPTLETKGILHNPQQITVKFDEWTFDSCFDSGNLARVEKSGNEQVNTPI